MFLSRLQLNPRSRQVQREVADPYQRHRTIMRAFREDLPEEERVLHRLEQEPRSGRLLLLVQSHTRPDWEWLDGRDYLLPADPFDPAGENPAVKSFDLPLSRGQILRFRLRANPTVKKKRPGRKHGNRVPLVREEGQREWLERQADRCGFRLLEANVSAEADRHGRVEREERTHRLTLHVVQFDGRLQVDDPEKMRGAVRGGIGPAKAFGCGLLSLAPA